MHAGPLMHAHAPRGTCMPQLLSRMHFPRQSRLSPVDGAYACSGVAERGKRAVPRRCCEP